jgi:hypothetical protein
MRNGGWIRWGAAAAMGLALAAAGPARAGDGGGGGGAAAAPAQPPKKDGRPVSSDDAAKIAIERFEQEFKAQDENRRMNAIQNLGGTKNNLVTKRLGELLRNANLEIRMAAAAVLDAQYQDPALAGEYLRKALSSEDEADVLCMEILSIGRLDYKEAVPDLGDLATKHENVWVKIEVLKAFGKMKDRRALLPILDLWLVNPHGYKTGEGGEEHYDSGAAGDHDQKEAERRYKEKHKGDQRRGAPPVMLKTYIQAIVDACEKICGEPIATPTELMQWLVKHEAELGFKLPGKVKTTLKEFEDRTAKRKKP